MKYKFWFFALFLLFINCLIYAQTVDSSNHIYHYTLKELAKIKTTTGSIKAEKITSAPSNITIITREIIDERGYHTLVDICQDIPGFDFSMYNDGGGEYPTYNLHRGMGDIGNPEILIMIDGIVQNNISFNWSLLWTNEHTLIDVDRIEIIQGPGSVVYGAQAFTGVINIITKNDFNSVVASSAIGSNSTYATDLYVGFPILKKINTSISLRKYKSNGDYGKNRYDPGGYFRNNLYPDILMQNYNENGEYVENTINPKGGQAIPDGFNTENDSYTVRSKLKYKNTELGFFISDIKRANASYLVPYEYDITRKAAYSYFRSYHSYLKHHQKFTDKLNLVSNIVFRSTNIIPSKNVFYNYRFPDMSKSYAAYAYQGYVEEKLNYTIKNNDFSIGVKGLVSQKTERIHMLDGKLLSKSETNSSWDQAVIGNGIYINKTYPVFNITEFASYILWDKSWFANLTSTAGIRYDYSSEFGSIINPRLAVDFVPNKQFGTKLLFGTAFRQPSIFELTSEFRGNPDLIPQRISTAEIEFNSLLFEDKISLRLNNFYSIIDHSIGKVADETMPSGERYENTGGRKILGLSTVIILQANKYIRFSTNYNFLVGIDNSNKAYDIDRTAKHKINTGINIKLLNEKLITDLRSNWVGKRKAQLANTWLQTYEGGYAPSYFKANLVITYKITQRLFAQLNVDNVFNEKYYGIGWETGSGFIDDYDFQNHVNPAGHIPSYHPQPGRTYLFKLILQLQ